MEALNKEAETKKQAALSARKTELQAQATAPPSLEAVIEAERQGATPEQAARAGGETAAPSRETTAATGSAKETAPAAQPSQQTKNAGAALPAPAS